MDAEWLKAQFEINPGKTKAELARVLGLEPPAISKILKGSRQIKAPEYIVMRRFFGLPAEQESARFEGMQRNSYTITPLLPAPVNALRDGGEPARNDWVIPAEILSTRTNAEPHQIRIFRIHEGMMEPDFRQGEHVLVDLSNTKPSPPGNYIISDGFGYMARFCEYMPRSNPAAVRISAIQKQFQPQILRERDFEILGRIIAKLQMV